MNIMTIDGYSARIEYDPDLDTFRGAILGLNGGPIFTVSIPSSCAPSSENRAIAAQAEGKSINTLAQEALSERVAG